MVVYIVLIIAITCLTRIPFLNISNSDRFTQMWVIQNAYYYSGKKGEKNNSLIKGHLFYPLFPALLIRSFPEKYWILLGTCLNILGDIFTAILIFFLLIPNERDLYWSSFLISILWTTLPILHPVNARLVGIGARGIAPFFYFVYFLSIGKVIDETSLFYLIPTIVAAVCVIISSQFGLQALIFTSMGLAFFFKTFIPILVIITILLISLFIPAFNLKNQLLGKLFHYQWYWLHGRQFLSKRNNLLHFLKLFKKNPASYIVYFFTSLTPVIVILGFSGIVGLCIFLQFFEKSTFGSHDFNSYYLAIFFSVLIISLLTMKGPLIIFGESERYLEYASGFIVLLITSVLNFETITRVVPSLIALNLVIIFLNLNLFKIDYLSKSLFPSEDPEIRKLISYLCKRKIITSPVTFSSVLAFYDKKNGNENKYLNHLVYNTNTKLSHWPSGNAVYPAIEMNSSFLMNKFEIDTVIVQKQWTSRLNGCMNPKNLVFKSTIETENYQIFFLK
jgi:hypothetical protein